MNPLTPIIAMAMLPHRRPESVWQNPHTKQDLDSHGGQPAAYQSWAMPCFAVHRRVLYHLRNGILAHPRPESFLPNQHTKQDLDSYGGQPAACQAWTIPCFAVPRRVLDHLRNGILAHRRPESFLPNPHTEQDLDSHGRQRAACQAPAIPKVDGSDGDDDVDGDDGDDDDDDDDVEEDIAEQVDEDIEDIHEGVDRRC